MNLFRNHLHFFLYIVIILIVSGCGTKLPKTMGERNSGYSYIPIDPLPIFTGKAPSCQEKDQYKELLQSLPDQAVRLAVGEFDMTGSLTFGPASIGVEGRSYQVVLDYISVDVGQLPVFAKVQVVQSFEDDNSISVYQEQTENPSQLKKNKFDYEYRIKPAPRFNLQSGDSKTYFDTLAFTNGPS